MAQDSQESSAGEPKPDGRVNNGNTEGTRRVLREHAIKPGECKNPSGMNGWRKAQARIHEFMTQVANAGSDQTRFDRILQATYASALVPGPRGAPDRKLLIEQVAGKAKQQLDLSNPDGTLQPVRGDAILSALQAAIAAKKNEAEEEQGGTSPGTRGNDGTAGG